MDRIRPWLWIGCHREAGEPRTFDIHGIGAVLTLEAPVEILGVERLHLPVEDGIPLDPALLRRGLEFIGAQKASGRAVLVACGAGISRSASFCAAALRKEEGLGLLKAMSEVSAAHPDALPHPALWTSLCSYFGEAVPLGEMLSSLPGLSRGQRQAPEAPS